MRIKSCLFLLVLILFFITGCGGSSDRAGGNPAGLDITESGSDIYNTSCTAKVVINWQNADRAAMRNLNIQNEEKTIPTIVQKIIITAKVGGVTIQKSAERPASETQSTIYMYQIPPGEVEFTAEAYQIITKVATARTKKTLQPSEVFDVELNFIFGLVFESIDPSEVDADNSHTSTIKALLFDTDKDGNVLENLSNAVIKISYTGNITTAVFSESGQNTAEVKTDDNGIAIFHIKSPDPGTINLKAQYLDPVLPEIELAVTSPTDHKVTFKTSGAIKTLTASPSEIFKSDETVECKTTVTALLEKTDAGGNPTGEPLADKEIVFTTTKGVFVTQGGEVNTVTVKTASSGDNKGKAIVEFKSYEKGEAKITASLKEKPDIKKDLTITIYPEYTMESLSATADEISISKPGNETKTIITAVLRKYKEGDVIGTPTGGFVIGKDVVFTASPIGVFETGGGGTSDTKTVQTNGSGQASVTFKSFDDGTATITATVSEETSITGSLPIGIQSGDVIIIIDSKKGR